MKKFAGFPARMQFTPIPNVFLSSLLPQITDIAELKITLHLFALLYRKKGYPRFVTYNELLNDASLRSSLREDTQPTEEVLHQALDMAVQRGTILHLLLMIDESPEDVYFLNTESDRRAAVKIQNGELILAGLKAGTRIETESEVTPPDIFTLYEENIGMLTPMIAEELRAAEKLYPQGWIEDAIKEAAKQNARKWSYISAVLERWSQEGKSDGTYRRDSKANQERYHRQKYGHMVQR
ncbi:MAG: DnaD domain protein [Chloroflexota bacterium]